MRPRIALVLGWALMATASLSVRAAEPIKTVDLSADLTVEIDGPILADLPLQLKLTITNTGQAPLRYWWGGPGPYPTARPFAAEVTDAKGSTRWSPLHNGQAEQGSGEGRLIEKVQELPAACDPLGPGTYTLRVIGKPEVSYPDGKAWQTWPAMRARLFRPSIVWVIETGRSR